MKYIRAFGAFWWDFIVGDDWRVAAGVALGLAITAFLAHRGPRRLVGPPHHSRTRPHRVAATLDARGLLTESFPDRKPRAPATRPHLLAHRKGGGVRPVLMIIAVGGGLPSRAALARVRK